MTLIHERHGLLCAGNPFAAERLEFAEQPALFVVEDQAVRVPLQETIHFLFVLIERGARGSALGVVGGEQVPAHVYAQLGETPGEIPQSGECHDPRFRYEPAALLDLQELQPGEDAKPHQRHERYRQQEDQAFGDRHLCPSPREHGSVLTRSRLAPKLQISCSQNS